MSLRRLGGWIRARFGNRERRLAGPRSPSSQSRLALLLVAAKTNTLSFTVDDDVLTPAQALAAVQANQPDIVAPSTEVDSEGDTLSPTLTGPSAGDYGSDGTLREATSVETNYDQGFDVGATGAEVGISPTGVGPDATDSIVAGGDAAVYANTQYATDAVVRPSANGVETFLQLRNGAAPESFSWRVALGSTESLVSKSNGDIAMVDSTPPVRAETLEVPPTLPAPDDVVDNPDDRVPSDPDVNDIPPPDDTGPITFDTPTVTEKFVPPGVSPTSLPAGTGANDTAAQANRETAAAASAQETTSIGEVQAVFLKPTAQDAAGRSVPVTMSVSGSTITAAVSHRGGGFTYPITVDPETSAAGSGAALQAASTGEIRVMTWNIKGSPKGGPKNARLGSVAGLLTSQHTEVALLQEVCNGKWLEKLHTELNKRGHPMLIWFYREGGATPGSKFLCGDATTAMCDRGSRGCRPAPPRYGKARLAEVTPRGSLALCDRSNPGHSGEELARVLDAPTTSRLSLASVSDPVARPDR